VFAGFAFTGSNALGYVLLGLPILIAAVIWLKVKSGRTFVRFHAMQSFGLAVTQAVLYSLLSLTWVTTPALAWVGTIGDVVILAYVVVSVFLMFRAYAGHMPGLPVIGKVASARSNKIIAPAPVH
jgi:uncharacterized membrane protein